GARAVLCVLAQAGHAEAPLALDVAVVANRAGLTDGARAILRTRGEGEARVGLTLLPREADRVLIAPVVGAGRRLARRGLLRHGAAEAAAALLVRVALGVLRAARGAGLVLARLAELRVAVLVRGAVRVVRASVRADAVEAEFAGRTRLAAAAEGVRS